MARPAKPVTAPALPERQDVNPARVYLAGAGLVGILAVSLALLWFVFASQSSGPAIGLARPDPAAGLAAFNAREAAELDGLGWVNRSAGIAHIPVADAMAIIVQRGKLPQWPAAQPADDECATLESNVPRTPAAANCRAGWQQLLGRSPL